MEMFIDVAPCARFLLDEICLLIHAVVPQWQWYQAELDVEIVTNLNYLVDVINATVKSSAYFLELITRNHNFRYPFCSSPQFLGHFITEPQLVV